MLHPAGPNGASAGVPRISKLPEDIAPEIRSVISRLREYKQSTEWSDIDTATSILDDDAVYDSPFMYITGGRDRVRAVAKLLAPFAYTEFEPKLVHVGMNSPAKKAEIDVEGTLRVIPRKYWFLPLTWLLPSSIPVQGTVTVHVKSWNDKVSRVQERFANVPNLVPVALRWLVGFGVGTFGAVSEPLLAQLYEWYSTGYQQIEGTTQRVAESGPVAALSSKVEGAQQQLAAGVDSVKARVGGMLSSE